MADYDSSLPIRTQVDGDVVVRLGDGTTPSQQLAIDAAGKIKSTISEGGNDAVVTASNELKVLASAQPGVDIGDVTINNASGAAAVNIQDGGNSITVDASDLDIRDLSSATDSVTVLATDLDIRDLNSATDSVTVTGAVTVSATDLDIRDLSAATDSVTVEQGTSPWVTSVNNLPATVDTNFGAVGASTLRSAAQIGNATGAADFGAGASGAQTLRVEANQGAASATPWAFTFTTPGAEVNDFKNAPAVAAGAADSHDYIVTAGKTLKLNQIEGSASGKAKMTVQVETAPASGVFATRFVQFNSTAETNMEIHLDNPISVPAGTIVRISMGNRDLAAQDLYSTISGYEI